MRRIFTLSLLVCCIAAFSYGQEFRDPEKWPFSQNSIWNMPIGSGARYVDAGIERSTARGMTIDEDIIVMEPGVELISIFENNAGWNRDKDRCIVEGDYMFSTPVPRDFIVSPSTWDGLTPNSGLAALMPDGKTIKQTQPFAHCSEGLTGTSRYTFSDMNIYGTGYYGAHGGSRLSAIGGALRIGELTPDSGPIRHALKVNLYCDKNVYYDAETEGYRWPALTADGAAAGSYGTKRTSPPVEECRMGALLALPPSLNLDSLGFETEPARILAEAFRDYGAYLVDNTGWDVYAIITEWSPKGRFVDEFQKNWGFNFKQSSKDTPWSRDMDRIFLNLHVVDNNSADSIGGGGIPRMPLAPDFLPTIDISLETDGTQGVKFSRLPLFPASVGTQTKVMVTSVPEGYVFKNWEVVEGDAIVTNPAERLAVIDVNENNSTLRANFELMSFSLDLNVQGEGQILADPDLEEYNYGSEITLTANPSEDWIFDEWLGNLEGSENPVTITISDNIEVTAVFSSTVGINQYGNSMEGMVSIMTDTYNNTVIIKFNGASKGNEILILDILGKPIYRKRQSFEKQIDISLNHLNQGIYFIRVLGPGGISETKKFFKK